MALDVNNMIIDNDKVMFSFTELLKTSRPGRSFSLTLERYRLKELCVLSTLKEYIKRTSEKRKSSQLLVSFQTYNKVSTSTIARWIKTAMSSAGIDISVFKAHSVRGAVASAAESSGLSLETILKTGNWTSSKNFYKFYRRDVPVATPSTGDSGQSFMDCVLNKK